MRHWTFRLLGYARGQSAGLGGILALTALTVGLDAVKPWPMKVLVDNALSGKPLPDTLQWVARLPGGGARPGLLAWLAAATVVLFATRQIVELLLGYVRSGVGGRLSAGLGGVLFERMQRLTVSFHGHHKVGDISRRITNDTKCVQELVMDVGLPIITSVASLAVMFIIMWRMDRALTLVSLLVVPGMALLTRLLSPQMMQRTYEQYEWEGRMASTAEQALSALPVVQAFGREPHEQDRFRQVTHSTLRAYLGAITSQLKYRIGVGSITATGTALVMAVGGLHVLAGSLTVGGLLVFLSYLGSLYAPLESLAFISVSYATASSGARRILEVLDSSEEVEERSSARPLEQLVAQAPLPATVRPAVPHRASGSIRGSVRLEGVTFGYEAERPVLKGVDLAAEPGETIALVGSTGAGKSTLVSLIPRFFDPWSGRVLLDGVDVREATIKSLREQIALVLQEPFLLPLSVAENIAYGRPSASRSEIEQAAVAARADEFILRLPEGYDTVVGERGATLSGGQRQRLSIARALLKDAPVLILDEPTSALDARTEGLLLEALGRLMEGRTTFLIAHRLSTIRGADRIAVLEDGCVVEIGSHQQLLQQHGTYYSLYQCQSAEPLVTGGNG